MYVCFLFRDCDTFLQNAIVFTVSIYCLGYSSFLKLFKKHLQSLWCVLLQCSVPEGDLHCQCILSIFPASLYQFYATIIIFVNIKTYLSINDQFALDFSMKLKFSQPNLCYCNRVCTSVIALLGLQK